MTWPNDSDSPSEAALRAEREQPVVLVIGNPDASDEILLFGLPENVRVEYLDLGASFDVRHRDHWSRIEASGWVEGQRAGIAGLPPEHRARLRMTEVVDFVCDAFGLEPDGSLAE